MRHLPLYFVGIGLVMLCVGVLGGQDRPSTPSLYAYTIELEQGGKVVCVVADHYGGLAIDCAWDRP